MIFIGFQRGVFVAGLREEIVNSAEQVLELIQHGEGLTNNVGEKVFSPLLSSSTALTFYNVLCSK